MSVDVTPLLEKIAKLADELEADYGTGVELVNAIVIVELLPTDTATAEELGECMGDYDDPDDLGSIIEHRALVRSTAASIGLVLLANDSLRTDYTRGD